MKDLNGVELKTGQKVVFSVGTKLVLRTVSHTTQREVNGRQYKRCKVILKTPEKTFERGRMVRNQDGVLEWQKGDEKAPRFVREVYSSNRILVLDNSKK